MNGVYRFDPLHLGWPLGVRIVESEFCVDVSVYFDVVRAGVPWKRRKRWRVQRREERKPGCRWCAFDGGYYIMHPSIVQQLKAQHHD